MRDPEEGVIHGLLAALGSARLAIAMALDERFGAEATVALVFASLGLVGLWRSSRCPR
jgi:hypothetical protein